MKTNNKDHHFTIWKGSRLKHLPPDGDGLLGDVEYYRETEPLYLVCPCGISEPYYRRFGGPNCSLAKRRKAKQDAKIDFS